MKTQKKHNKILFESTVIKKEKQTEYVRGAAVQWQVGGWRVYTRSGVPCTKVTDDSGLG